MLNTFLKKIKICICQEICFHTKSYDTILGSTIVASSLTSLHIFRVVIIDYTIKKLKRVMPSSDMMFIQNYVKTYSEVEKEIAVEYVHREHLWFYKYTSANDSSLFNE
jgi:hypothetical protein